MAAGLRPAVPAYGVVTEKPAKQHPPIVSPRQPQYGEHPTEVGGVAHRIFESQRDSVQLSEIVVLVVVDIRHIDVADRRLDRFHIRRLVGVPPSAYLAGESLAWHGGKGRKTLPTLTESARGQSSNRRGVEAAAEAAPDRSCAAQLPPDRAVEAGAQVLGIGFVGRQVDRFAVGCRPILLGDEGSRAIDGREMRRRQSIDVTIKRRCVLPVIEHQEIGDFLLVDLARHVGQRKQPLRHRGESEEAIAFVPHHHVVAEMVACQGQRLVARVPDRHGKRPAQQSPDVLAEFLPGRE